MNIPEKAVEIVADTLAQSARAQSLDELRREVREGFRSQAFDLLEFIAPSIAAQAWQEGFKQGGPMHDVDCDDPDAHTRNPYL